jgi:hypothetical protein
MTENIPPDFEQSRQLHQSLTEKVLDRAASDPLWKQQLLDNPNAAMQEANFPEVQMLEEIRLSAEASLEEAEVHGHGCQWHYTYYYTQSNCCRYFTAVAVDLGSPPEAKL